ncbi:group II intron maturase-specific domain-containing protein [Staphylococcus pseudintermedius]|uniref:group II intron maturase-specific domain-containing protein n=1 Tax=Staphylococcus pseudintermedius TaxID=283734 RepID=UPI001F4EBAEA|nr:group II intron maturase-specific domain-containing protein [Staphylococcus pseudintermedius]
MTRSWIKYFGRGFIREFIETTQSWLNRRIRQLILNKLLNRRVRNRTLGGMRGRIGE